MKKYLFILLLGLTILGCQESAPIQLETIVGEFSCIQGSEDYSKLELRSDSTYHFIQSKFWSCDLWNNYYGYFEINGNKLSLFKGTNLDSLIEVTTKEEAESNTLLISLSKNLMDSLPNLKVKLGFDSLASPIVNRQILVNKNDYKHLKINLRAKGFYYQIDYVSSLSEIHFDTRQLEIKERPKELLLEYTAGNTILSSNTSTEWINDHILERREVNTQKSLEGIY